jgi:hypothetical protein
MGTTEHLEKQRGAETYKYRKQTNKERENQSKRINPP